MARTHPLYPPKFRLEAVRLVKEGNRKIADVARDLGVSRESIRNWIRQNAKLMKLIVEIHRESRGTYGAPRIHAELRIKYGIRCSKKRVARRLMRKANLVGVHRRRLKGCTKRDPARPSYPDLVQRSFTATAPNQLWVADITQHVTTEG